VEEVLDTMRKRLSRCPSRWSLRGPDMSPCAVCTHRRPTRRPCIPCRQCTERPFARDPSLCHSAHVVSRPVYASHAHSSRTDEHSMTSYIQCHAYPTSIARAFILQTHCSSPYPPFTTFPHSPYRNDVASPSGRPHPPDTASTPHRTPVEPR